MSPTPGVQQQQQQQGPGTGGGAAGAGGTNNNSPGAQELKQSKAKLLASLKGEIEELRQEILKKKSGESLRTVARSHRNL